MGRLISEEITFRKLKILIAYMESGSLAKAAERLNVSAVSVHRALHTLEEGMQCALFYHEGRNLIPTAAAKVLAKSAADVLDHMALAIQAAREAAGLYANKLRIGSMYSLTAQVVPRIVSDMKLRRPDLVTELELGSNAELTDKLKRGLLDASLMAILQEDPEIETLPLFGDDIFFVCPVSAPYAKLDSINLEDLREEPFVCLNNGSATSAGFHEAFARASFRPKMAMEVGDVFSLMNLVSGGLGYALSPGRMQDLFGGQLRFIPLQERFRIRQTVGLNFLRARQYDPNLLALVAVCRMIWRDGAVATGRKIGL